MAKAFVVDVAKCSGCYSCQTACKDEHVDNDWTPYAKPQPEIGQFWTRLEEHVEGTIPKVRVHYIVRMCNHCKRPACLSACSVGAIKKRTDGLVLIDAEKCSGCGDCAAACPYGVIYQSEAGGVCQKCTGCAHLLDNGYELPRCVENCPTDALRFGEEEDLAELIEGASVWKPETGCGPRMYYRNIPGKFIGGTVYDPVDKEVVIGARCIAVNGGKIAETATDDFGDFWFEDLAVGKYDVTVFAEGFAEEHRDGVHARESVNLGSIPLTRQASGADEAEAMAVGDIATESADGMF